MSRHFLPFFLLINAIYWISPANSNAQENQHYFNFDCDQDYSDDCSDFTPYICYQHSHRFSVGPEFYHVHRKRSGGTCQDGMMYGGEGRYERIQANSFYWGGHWRGARGRLYGHNAGGNRIVSKVIENEVEGRFGFTFQPCWNFNPTFIPFVGYGSFSERSKFISPTPITIHYHNRFNYFAFGFFSEVSFNDTYSLGFNVTMKYALDCKSKISHDPLFPDRETQFQPEMQYDLEFPISYRFPCYDQLQLNFVPFYQFRHYGGRENFPFDFLDTRFNIVGARVLFSIRV